MFWVRQFDRHVTGEPDVFERLADGMVVHGAFADCLRPGAIRIFVADVDVNDLPAKPPDEINRVDVAANQPVQVRPKFDIGNPCQRTVQIVHAVGDFVCVIVQIENDAMRITQRNQLAQQICLVVIGGSPRGPQHIMRATRSRVKAPNSSKFSYKVW